MPKKGHGKKRFLKATAIEKREFQQGRERQSSIRSLLRDHPMLPVKDIDFAISLCSQYERTGQLSDRQWIYVVRLAITIKVINKGLAAQAKKARLLHKPPPQPKPEQPVAPPKPPKPKKVIEVCSVYAIGRDDQVKIGISKTPRKRMRDLQVAHGVPLKLLWHVQTSNRPTARKIERRIHDAFTDKHLQGEWFHKSIVAEAQSMAIKLVNKT